MRTTDEFFAILDQYMAHLQIFYKRHAAKKPIMELSLPSRKIYAYPYAEYAKTLSNRSQELLKKEYRTAIRRKRMVVFVRDDKERVLKSISIPIDETDHPESEISD